MARIVLGMAASHWPLLATPPDVAILIGNDQKAAGTGSGMAFAYWR